MIMMTPKHCTNLARRKPVSHLFNSAKLHLLICALLTTSVYQTSSAQSIDNLDISKSSNKQQNNNKAELDNWKILCHWFGICEDNHNDPNNNLSDLSIKTPQEAREAGFESLKIAVENDGGVPLPDDLDRYVVNRKRAEELGKALFWDMQVGSDGIQACASCHFHAGADVRTKNQMDPNFTSSVDISEDDILGYLNAPRSADDNFEIAQPNERLKRHHFPFVKNIQSLVFNSDQTVRPGPGNSNDVAGSMGMPLTFFEGVIPGEAVDQGTGQFDPVWNVNGDETVRRAEPRNAPSVINAVFNFTNFWDGRARPHFNGQSIEGEFIAVNDPDNGLMAQAISINNMSLASQALQPVNSPSEMAFGTGVTNARSLPDLGMKLIRPSVQTEQALRPLQLQKVHPQDSLLGALARGQDTGLDTTYMEMIQAAFSEDLWNSSEMIELSDVDSFTQMEFNFGLFFGLSIALYEATLVSDRTPFDKWMETGRFNRGFREQELEQAVIGARSLTEGAGLFDLGFHNTSVTPTTDDIGRGAQDSTGAPLSFARKAIVERQANMPIWPVPVIGNEFIPSIDEELGKMVCSDDDNDGFCSSNEGLFNDFIRVSVDGAFKTPGLRNVELTGPYFHNGGMATLRQTVQFYNRGGNFCGFNKRDLHTAIAPLELSNKEERQLVDFMVSLTDSRVKYRRAPFDHPSLGLPVNGRKSKRLFNIKAVGKYGSYRPLKPFLRLNPQRKIFTPSGICSTDVDPRG